MKPKPKLVSFRIDKELYDKLKIEAIHQGLSVQKLICDLIEKLLT